MKPIKLEFQAFGPYIEKQVIDFEELSEKGIFLITGDTGSGKTTIFDAMTFALYGGASGESETAKNGRNDIDEWRCTLADDKTDTYVEFIFESNGQKYYFKRITEMKRKNLSKSCDGGTIDSNDTKNPFFENPKETILTQKAEELVGLTKDQFKQVVLLPQGQFERFLVASSGEKEGILQKIFDSEMWRNLAEQFYANANSRKKDLEALKTEVYTVLINDGFSNIDEIDTKAEQLKEQKNNIEKEHNEFDGSKKQEELNKDIALATEFKHLHVLENELSTLKADQKTIDEKKEKRTAADRAEKVRTHIDEFEKSKKEKTNRENELKAAQQELPQKEKEKLEAEQAYNDHIKKVNTDEINAKVGEYQSKEELYKNFEAIEGKYREALNALNAAETIAEKSEENLMKAKNNAVKAKEVFDKASETAKEYRDTYFAGIYGEIASSLSEGDACPVCGSTEHPQIAKRKPDSVSKKQVEEAEAFAEEKHKKFSECDKKREEAENKYNTDKENVSEKKEKKASSEAELKNAKDSLIEGIDSFQSLEKEINHFQKIIDEFKNKENELREKVKKCENEISAVKAKIGSAKKEKENADIQYSAAEKSLKDALEANGYSDIATAKVDLLTDQARQQLQKDIVEHETKLGNTEKNLKEKADELYGKKEPDAVKFAERQNEIKEEAERYNNCLTQTSNEIKRLSDLSHRLNPKMDKYNAEIREAEADLAFARKLRGETGVGITRYVLAIRFSQVVAEANRMLAKVHGGRYTLFVSGEGGKGNKKGLDLKVHDNWKPEKEGRNVSMLSGGEKFLVSLALSIGMSTVAQKGGKKIEALFIDEGFGTLDNSSIDDAMSILDSVQKSSGMIGIISHVEMLESNITTHLDVIKSEKGSSIRKNY